MVHGGGVGRSGTGCLGGKKRIADSGRILLDPLANNFRILSNFPTDPIMVDPLQCKGEFWIRCSRSYRRFGLTIGGFYFSIMEPIDVIYP